MKVNYFNNGNTCTLSKSSRHNWRWRWAGDYCCIRCLNCGEGVPIPSKENGSRHYEPSYIKNCGKGKHIFILTVSEDYGICVSDFLSSRVTVRSREDFRKVYDLVHT